MLLEAFVRESERPCDDDEMKTRRAWKIKGIKAQVFGQINSRDVLLIGRKGKGRLRGPIQYRRRLCGSTAFVYGCYLQRRKTMSLVWQNFFYFFKPHSGHTEKYAQV